MIIKAYFLWTFFPILYCLEILRFFQLLKGILILTIHKIDWPLSNFRKLKIHKIIIKLTYLSSIIKYENLLIWERKSSAALFLYYTFIFKTFNHLKFICLKKDILVNR